jgi:hypothetical protein
MPVVLRKASYLWMILSAVAAAGVVILLVGLLGSNGGPSFRIGRISIKVGRSGLGVGWPVPYGRTAGRSSGLLVWFVPEEPVRCLSGLHQVNPPPPLPVPTGWNRLEFSWLLLAGFSALACINVSAFSGKRTKPNRSLCAKCGYDPRATPARCPECGVACSPAIR